MLVKTKNQVNEYISKQVRMLISYHILKLVCTAGMLDRKLLR